MQAAIAVVRRVHQRKFPLAYLAALFKAVEDAMNALPEDAESEQVREGMRLVMAQIHAEGMAADQAPRPRARRSSDVKPG
jgi:hypothetical protein